MSFGQPKMEIQPIESFILDGMLKRFATVFGCRALITTSNDKTRVLERLFDGKQIEYPYAFFTPQSMSDNKESYRNVSSIRRGVRVVTGQNQQFTARILPTNFAFEVEFHTNKYKGMEPETVMSYARRWLFAMRCGYLKFNVQYGSLQARIGVTMDDNVPTPPQENRTDSEAVYKIVTNLTVHGYTSEPILGSQGVIQEIDLSTLFGPNSNHVFVPFE